MTVLSLGFCARAFSSCGKWGPLFIAVLVLLSLRTLQGCQGWGQRPDTGKRDALNVLTT